MNQLFMPKCMIMTQIWKKFEGSSIFFLSVISGLVKSCFLCHFCSSHASVTSLKDFCLWGHLFHWVNVFGKTVDDENVIKSIPRKSLFLVYILQCPLHFLSLDCIQLYNWDSRQTGSAQTLVACYGKVNSNNMIWS